jgi:uncharacterized membrane protein
MVNARGGGNRVDSRGCAAGHAGCREAGWPNRTRRTPMIDIQTDTSSFPVSAGILFGLALGGFFDGVVLHQILQWHHLLSSAGVRANSLAALEYHVFWDGLFHIVTYAFMVAGLVSLWRAAHRTQLWWSGKLMLGTLLIGFGLFNVGEGLVAHHLLGLHHVNETVPPDQWIYWDVGFLLWGLAMLLGGLVIFRDGRREMLHRLW